MKKIVKSFICCVFMIGLFSLINLSDIYAANTFFVNGKTKVTVNKDETVIYDLFLGEDGCFNLLTSTSYEDRKQIYIALFDSNNKEIVSDNGKWRENAMNTNLHDLSIPIQLTAGAYKVSFRYVGDKSWSYDVTTRFLANTNIPVNYSESLTLYRNENMVYKVNVPANGYYIIHTSTATNPLDVYFYILDANGNQIDDDDMNPDWTTNQATGMYTMNWTTKSLVKGQYYIKVCNKSNGILTLPIKTTYKIPATKLTLKKTSITLKKGKKYNIKSVVKPSLTTDTLKYSSSNKKVATVSKKGVITAKKKGKATITVKTTSGISKKIKVTVK